MKVCINCGKEMPDTGKFCAYCNARQPEPVPGETAKKIRGQAPGAVQKKGTGQAEEREPENTISVEPESRSGKERVTMLWRLVRRHRVLALAAVAVIAVLAVILGITAGRAAEIDLAAYTEVRFTGYNGNGTAKVDFDDNAFLSDVARAMAKKGVISRATARDITPETVQERMNANWEDGAKIARAADEITYSLDRTQGLSNGDVVTVTYRCNNAEAKKYGLRFAGQDKTAVVQNLDEMERFDAFAGVEVSFSGPDRFGEAGLSRTGSEEIYNQLTYTADRASELRNGERITVSITNRSGTDDFSEIGRIYGKVPAETAREYEVSGLAEAPVFDAFAGLSVTVEGVEPFGYISLANLDESNDIWFEADRYDGLSNGDMIIVRAIPGYTGSFNEDYVEIYGQIPETAEKIVEIQGLPVYVRELAEIPTDVMTDMKKEAGDRLNAYVAEEWEKESDRLVSGTYKGAYLLTAKDESISWNRNQLYLIYEVSATALSEGGNQEITFFFYTRLHDILKNSDGSCTVDLTEAEIPYAVFDTGVDGHYYTGYSTLETLVGDVITSQSEMYTIETDMGG